MIELTVQSEGFARCLGNALAFIPANSRLPYLWLQLNPATASLRALGTDGYAGGMETLSWDGYQGPSGPTVILLPKGKPGGAGSPPTGAAGVERTVRLAGNGPCDITVTPDSFTVAPMGGETLTVPVESRSAVLPAYQTVVDVLGDVQRRQEIIPGVVCLDPALLSRFSKVKADKAERRADFLFGPDELSPVLVKIGLNFTGFIVPVDRGVQSKNVGSDGLW